MKLLDYVQNNGYPRGLFIALDFNEAIHYHENAISNPVKTQDGVFITEEKYPFVYKVTVKKDKIETYDNYIKTYFLNSCIKNILLEPNEYSLIVKCNTLVYLFYYYSIYGYKLKTLDKVTDNVIMYILQTIKILQDKADTLYRDYPARECIDQLRTSLQIEQLNNDTFSVNIR